MWCCGTKVVSGADPVVVAESMGLLRVGAKGAKLPEISDADSWEKIIL